MTERPKKSVRQVMDELAAKREARKPDRAGDHVDTDRIDPVHQARPSWTADLNRPQRVRPRIR